MKKILGLDLGTNSIGWALIEKKEIENTGKILGMGSRIIPMGQDIKDEFGKGNPISKTADRTRYRLIRRIKSRKLLRRERLHRILNILDFLPNHYKEHIDFTNRLGKFKENTEPKVAWKRNNEGKYEFFFKQSFLEMSNDFNGKEIPYDWTIYYLRKKALSKPISKEELSWVILNFNHKRGYYQTRGENSENNSNVKEFVISQKVIGIKKGEPDNKNKNRNWYNIELENGWVYNATFTTAPDWLNLEKEFLVVEELDNQGKIKLVKEKKTDSTGKEKRKITLLPTVEEIELLSKSEQDKLFKKIKTRTEATISNSGTTVGTYIYDTIIKRPFQKINGKLVRTIERKFYKEELIQILKTQIEFHPNLFSHSKFVECVKELYPNNDSHRERLLQKDFIHLIVEDILYYQRPIKSKKSTISNCSLEYREYTSENKNKNGENVLIKSYRKVVPKSNPLYQEFRVWQFINNLRIYKNIDNQDVTNEFLNNINVFELLFEFLDCRKKIDQKTLLEFLLKIKLNLKKVTSNEINKYRWNYVEDKEYSCNETKSIILERLRKVDGFNESLFNSDFLYQLWHITYSVNDKVDFEKALLTFARKNNLEEDSFRKCFKDIPNLTKEYGSYSEKALKKMLPLMRLGKFWNWDSINTKVQKRICKIIDGEYDEGITEGLRKKLAEYSSINAYQGLPEWIVKDVIYGYTKDTNRWTSTLDIDNYLNEFKQHYLRNPVVEQVVVESLRIVKDIWLQFGNANNNYFDEIHVELGREMKHTSEERKRFSEKNLENENTNARIKSLLMELMNDSKISGVKPFSPTQQEILKIYEEYAIANEEKYIGKNEDGEDIFQYEKTPDEILKISKLAQPTSIELTKYKLWLEQRYRSPYTGQMIPLSKLFTSEYEIEHVIPQSRYFDDSLSNKVICESAVNKIKDKKLGLEFIKEHQGQIIETGDGRRSVKILKEIDYIKFVNETYDKLRSKKNKLLLDEIPDEMIERQMNDTRYISKFVSILLSKLVRLDNDDGVYSKNIILGNGKITSLLKQDWGLNDVWNEAILPRFERMNQIDKNSKYTTQNKEGHFIPSIPFEYSKNFQKKRIDHRHHALDALVIACVTKEHVNLLNNLSAKSENVRYDLQNKLRNTEKWIDKNGHNRLKFTSFKKPWESFTIDAKEKLFEIVISYKQNLRVINKTKFKDLTYAESKKKSNDMNWSIRKPLHKETVSGEVKLPWIKVPKGKVLTASRKSINTDFDEKVIHSITDRGIQKILLNYLKAKGSPDIAFTQEGIEELNRNIEIYNDGFPHKPIHKVRIFESGSKFPLGYKGNNKSKFVEAAKGTNLFFAIYEDKNGKRSYNTISLNVVIERLKQGINPVPDFNDNSDRLLFYLSPNDLIYVDDGIDNFDLRKLNNAQKKNIYKVVSFTGGRLYAIPHYVAKSIVDKMEFTKLNKVEFTSDNISIKANCYKIIVDRLGNIKDLK